MAYALLPSATTASASRGIPPVAHVAANSSEIPSEKKKNFFMLPLLEMSVYPEVAVLMANPLHAYLDIRTKRVLQKVSFERLAGTYSKHREQFMKRQSVTAANYQTNFTIFEPGKRDSGARPDIRDAQRAAAPSTRRQFVYSRRSQA